jgi:flagellar assembly protein FliH
VELKKQILDSEDSKHLVFNYVPKQFPIRIETPASQFVQQNNTKSSDFKISELVAEQSGIADLNKKQVEIRVEAEALEKLKEVQERAYAEAYDLGLIEGKDKAYEDHTESIQNRILSLDKLLESFEKIKIQLVENNESQLMQLVHLISSRLAMDHIETNKEVVLNVIKQVIEDAQTDEEVVLKISNDDATFVSEMKARNDKSLDFLKNIKIESQTNIKSGGCILETRFGAIDATIEQRFEKVWKAIASKTPKVRNHSEENQ